MISPEAAALLVLMPEGVWTITREICASAGMFWKGTRDANHNLAYPLLKELVVADMVEKRLRPTGHPRYTEYRRKYD